VRAGYAILLAWAGVTMSVATTAKPSTGSEPQGDANYVCEGDDLANLISPAP
jgi:hypothetical protein